MTTVIVTGAGSGIGAATCRRLAALGHDLVIHTGQRREAAEALGAQLASAVQCRVVVGDSAQPATVAALVEAAQSLGNLAGVVANAGFADKRSIAQMDDAAIERSLQGMVVSMAHLMRATLPLLERSGQGRFVAVSSFVAHRFTLGGSFPATAAAKAGIEALVKAAAVEYAARGITVNAVAPGYVRKDNPRSSALSQEELQRVTARVPLGRLATPNDIAGAIVFLLSADAAYITGQVLHVDGGITL